MWESKEQTLDINYNVDELWFPGIYGQPVPKPLDIKKWEDGKCYLLLGKTIPRLKADRMLMDLSQIALKYAQYAVQQRLVLKPTSSGENRAPIVFQYDSGGDYLQYGLRLQQLQPVSVEFAEVEAIDDEGASATPIRPARSSTPAPIPTPTKEAKQQLQKTMMDVWVTDPEHPIKAEHKTILELYSALTDEEIVYVRELQKCYDEARCYFSQWILTGETKELVNSARIAALHANTPFTWRETRHEILKSLTDITLTARFLALSRIKRKNGVSAKLWVSQVLTRKALLEDSRLPTPIKLPEALYLELTLGQMTPAETTVFDIPAIGDDLAILDRRGRPKFTMMRLKEAVDACSNPPQFRGVKTPITELLDADDKPKRDANANPKRDGDKRDHGRKDKGNQLQNRQTTANAARDFRPAHEKPSAFPSGLKRPDPTSTVEGRKIANDAQRQLFDDIKGSRCTRCHKEGHLRSKCTLPAEKWEEKFDREK